MAKRNNANRSNKSESTFRKNGGPNKRDRNSQTKNRKFDRKEDRFDEEAIKGKTRASNDPAWYGASSGLMKDAANLSFNQMGGMPFNITGAAGDVHSRKQRLPGIYRADFLPMPGMLGDWTAPFNVAIRRIYSFIRHANSGHSNYDAADLGNYVLAYDSVVTFYAWMVRLYGMVRTVVLRNRFTPEIITRVLGVDYQSIVSNLAQFRYYINTYAARANAMKVPSTFNLYQRHMWLTSHIFMDAPVEQAQFYLPTPRWLWKFVVTDTEAKHTILPLFNYTNTSLTNVNEGYLEDKSKPLTYANIVAIGEELLNTILNSEDFNIMSGDIMKAYGDKVFTLNGVAEDYLTVPVFDPEFTLQFQNATILTYPEDNDDTQFPLIGTCIQEDTSETANVGALVFKEREDGAGIRFAPYHAYMADTSMRDTMAGNLYVYMNKICNLPTANVTPADVAVATRMMVSAQPQSPSFYKQVFHNEGHFDAYGTEIFLNAKLFAMGEDSVPVDVGYAQDPNDNINTEIFTGHPYYFDVTVSSNGGAPVPYSEVPTDSQNVVIHDFVPYGDFDNFAMVSSEVLRNIHSAALYGIYGLVE